MAAGRAVNAENIGLAECGVQVTDRGFIKVDQNLQTTAPGYYAIGDVAGPPMLAHKGMREGVTVTEIIAELTVARENEYTVEEVELAIHAHPTMSEAVAQAALDSLGRVVDM